jgi:hypothetical protein
MKYTVKIEIANRFYANSIEAEVAKEIKTTLIKKTTEDLDFAEAPTVLAIKNAVAEIYTTLTLFSASVKVKDVEKTDDAEVITDTKSISFTAFTGLSFEDAPKTDSAKRVAKLAKDAKLAEVAAAKAAAKAAEPVDANAEATKRIEDLKTRWEDFRAKIK